MRRFGAPLTGTDRLSIFRRRHLPPHGAVVKGLQSWLDPERGVDDTEPHAPEASRAGRSVRGRAGYNMSRTGGSNWFRWVAGAMSGFTLLCSPAARGQEAGITVHRAVTGLSQPVFVTHAPGDAERIFVAELSGVLKAVDLSTGASSTFVDITDRVGCCAERGLLGVAFHPRFSSNGYFYVNYTDLNGDTVISRFSVPSGATATADANSETVVLTIMQQSDRHNGGWIGFGPDGFLYIATGDGAAGDCDADGDAQNIDGSLLGKILRIDVDQGDPYGIPPDNPFAGGPGLDEVWAYGLRNPWRCAFDAATGDLYIADVGQSAWEEVNYQPAGSMGGENYGWNCMEGDHCSTDSGCTAAACTCFDDSLVGPVQEFDRSAGPAVIGGEVYRGGDIPALDGTYFLANGNDIWTFRVADGRSIALTNRTDELQPPTGQDIRSVTSFGVDARGEVYICDFADGEVFKVVSRNETPSPSDPPATPDVDAPPAPTLCGPNTGVTVILMLAALAALRAMAARLTQGGSLD